MSKPKSGSNGTIYFMRRADGVGPIKIGCTKHPLERLNQVQEWSPEPLTIIASASGIFRTERRLHRQFDQFRLHGEWFEAAPPVLSMVNRVAATGKIPPAPADDKWQQIASRYRGGETLAQIGDDLGITRERVRQILRKAGVPSEGYRDQHKRLSVASKSAARVIDLCRRGHTVPEIAEAVGDCRMNVSAVLRRNNLKARRGKRQCLPETVQKAHAVAADYQDGMLGEDIAKKYGIPQPSIYRLLRLAGVKPDRRAA